jgi:hypothetical protein
MGRAKYTKQALVLSVEYSVKWLKFVIYSNENGQFYENENTTLREEKSILRIVI